MKNITVSVDDDTYRRARIKATEQDTSVSAMVRAHLNNLASAEIKFKELERREKELRRQVPEAFSAYDRLPRDELYLRRR